MLRGEIILVELPQVDTRGHEQEGTRPALIVHDNATIDSLPVVMIVPITSRLSAMNYPHTILVQPSMQNGLNVPSILLLFQLRAIDKRRFVKTLGVLEAQIIEQVNVELKKLLGI
jgi:mRNA interferase MazF